jgi:hypothetical protein
VLSRKSYITFVMKFDVRFDLSFDVSSDANITTNLAATFAQLCIPTASTPRPNYANATPKLRHVSRQALI